MCVDGAREWFNIQKLTDRFWLRSCADLDTPLHMGNTWSRDNRRRGLGLHRVKNGRAGAFMRKKSHLYEFTFFCVTHSYSTRPTENSRECGSPHGT